MTDNQPVSNVRIYSPGGDGYTDSEMPDSLEDLYKLLRGARKQEDNGLVTALSRCIATLIALRQFDLKAGFDVVFTEDTVSCWEPKLVCVYSNGGELKELSPAMSIMVVCVAHANHVTPDMECMKDGKASLITLERVGRYRPVVFAYTPETTKAVDVTRSVVLVSPGIVARYRGSYDIATGVYRDTDEVILDVDKSLLDLGGSVS